MYKLIDKCNIVKRCLPCKCSKNIPIKRHIDLLKLDNQFKFLPEIQILIIQFLDLSVDLGYLRIFTRIYTEYVDFQRTNKFPIKCLSKKENWYLPPMIRIKERDVLMADGKSAVEDYYFNILRSDIDFEHHTWKHFTMILQNYPNILFTANKQKYYYIKFIGEGEFSTIKVKYDGIRDLRRNICYFPQYLINVALQLPVRMIFTKSFDDGRAENVTIQPSSCNVTVDEISHGVKLIVCEYKDTVNKLHVRLFKEISLRKKNKTEIIRPDTAGIGDLCLENVIMAPTTVKSSSPTTQQYIESQGYTLVLNTYIFKGDTLSLEYSTYKF